MFTLSRRLPRVTPLCVLWILSILCGCGLFGRAGDPVSSAPLDDPEPAAAPLTPREALRRLASDTGVAWRVRYHRDRQTAAFLEPLAPPPPLALSRSSSGDPRDSAARALLVRLLPLFGLARSGDLRLVEARDDLQGHRHIRFRQQRDNVAVHESALFVHLDARGAPTRLHAATLVLPPDLLPAFPLPEAAAVQAALTYLAPATPFAAALRASTPQRVLTSAGGQVRSAYRVDVEGQGPRLPLRRQLLIDARDGTVLRDADRLATLDAPRPVTGQGQGALGEARVLSVSQDSDSQGVRYQLVDLTRGGGRTVSFGEVRTPYGEGGRPSGTAATRPIESRELLRWDRETRDAPGAAVDLHAHLATTFDHFVRVHGRLGPAGDGQGAVAAAHYRSPGLPAARVPLAFYDGKALVFGDGDGVDTRPLAAALDIVAHEYTHAVLDSELALAQEGEAGAVGEGLANLFACFIERAALPAQAPSAEGSDPGWTVGERVLRGRDERGAEVARPSADLSAPQKSDQAEHTRGLDAPPPLTPPPAFSPQREAERFAWRRRAAGVIGLLGYRSAQHLGDRAAEALWYRAVTTYLHGNAGFSDVSDGLAAAAQDLHPGDLALGVRLQQLFRDLGVETLASAGVVAEPAPTIMGK